MICMQPSNLNDLVCPSSWQPASSRVTNMTTPPITTSKISYLDIFNILASRCKVWTWPCSKSNCRMDCHSCMHYGHVHTKKKLMHKNEQIYMSQPPPCKFKFLIHLQLHHVGGTLFNICCQLRFLVLHVQLKFDHLDLQPPGKQSNSWNHGNTCQHLQLSILFPTHLIITSSSSTLESSFLFL